MRMGVTGRVVRKSPRRGRRSVSPARKRVQAPAGALLAVGVRPSKAKGQNFLVQETVAQRIVEAAALERDDEVVEIGPGLGILSDRIARRPVRRLCLVEMDDRLAGRLKERFADDPRVEVVTADFLKAGLPALTSKPPVKTRVKIIGNLPFSTASAILRSLCDYQPRIARMVLMFQREVADRIRAAPGADGYAALSVFTALYWEVASHFRVAAGSFHPRPKVDAEVVVLRPRSTPACRPDEEQTVLEVIRASFAARRKTMRNNLQKGLHLDAAPVADALARAGIESSARAETLSVEDFVRLAREIRKPGASARTGAPSGTGTRDA
jgi:16S rRNA (adenine1518-N6/adenine1519-N6)-dimethyltransferase